MAYQVPFVDPRKSYRSLKSEIDAAMIGCLSRGDLIHRQQLRDFETHFASFVGVKYAVGVSSGYHALHFALQAAGVGAGDEVITVAHTFVATVSAIVNVGAHPVLVDVGKDYTMLPEAFEAAITRRTKAVIPVSLNGRVCEMDAILAIAGAHGIKVIEDAAQAVGAEYRRCKAGSFGLAGCFSFYPFKLLGSLGDGGAVATNDPEIALAVSRLRYNGEDRETGEYHFHGVSGLLDNIQAAVLDVKLRHLPKRVAHRRRMAALYHEALKGIDELELPRFDEADRRDVFQNYIVRTSERDGLRRHLTANGVETLVHWPKPMWEHKGLKLENPHLKETENISREVLSLPMNAEITADQIEIVTETVSSYFHSRRSHSISTGPMRFGARRNELSF
jgi:dTDP-3-amino-2,3,6-trideoxy-4-keto-D-glucose/dTDP-3-amino-3,4,6-trideoxy-alpha-D-glucose/dTDP-2,6-dideoxy-D-kanosamine transaminase